MPRLNPTLPPEQPLSVNLRVEADAVVLTVTGELDRVAAPQFRTAMNTAMHSTAARVVVDLQEVAFVDSSALQAFVLATQQAHQPLRFVIGHNQTVRRRIMATALDQVLTLCDGLTEALEALPSP